MFPLDLVDGEISDLLVTAGSVVESDFHSVSI